MDIRCRIRTSFAIAKRGGGLKTMKHEECSAQRTKSALRGTICSLHEELIVI